MAHMSPYVLIESYSHHGLVNFEFDATKPYRCCLLCGVVFQSPLDRVANPSFLEVLHCRGLRQEWADRHAKQHSEKEHVALRKSGRFCTPEAAHTLVPLGIAPVSDITMSHEHEHAGMEAPRVPTNDAEGV